MNAYVNYLIEANLALMITLLFYEVLLRRETQFNFKRAFLLVGITASLLFPLIKIQTASSVIPSIGEAMSTYFLPELVVGDEVASIVTTSSLSYWTVAKWLYITVSFLLLIHLIFKLVKIFTYLRQSKTSLLEGKYKVIESNADLPTFSFFHYIFIGNTSVFSLEEKDQIIHHEITHATKLHSLDILLVEFLKILFWFNPAVYYFKSLLTSIHEFQADQLAVENRDVNQYCNLLARVALQSADYPIANHFNNSLTLKRIDMMKTAKTKLSRWKIAMIAPLLIGLFVLIACQDQVMNDIQEIAKNSTVASLIPIEVQNRLVILQKENPTKEYILMEINNEDVKTLSKLGSQSLNIVHTDKNSDGEGRSFCILEKGEQTNQLAKMTATQDEVFTIVEESASPVNGLTEFYAYIAKNLSYPISARTKGIQGKVFVEFIITKDGSITEVKAVKGIGEGCDEAATTVVASAAKWNPGRVKGAAVNQRMVLPITFMLDGSDKKIEESKTESKTMSEMVVVGQPPKKN